MTYQPFLNNLLLVFEILTAAVAIFYYKDLKNTYWKWFVIYLIYIAVLESVGEYLFEFLNIKKNLYFAYFGIPFEYIFFFWLYSKSLNNKTIFYICTALFLLTFLPVEYFFKKSNIVYSINIAIGDLILMFLVVKEFAKQIESDNILQFKQNKMFYINIGVVFFYVGTFPFFGFYNLLLNEIQIWNNYYVYFLISNSIMYLLFTTSFIWGTQK